MNTDSPSELFNKFNRRPRIGIQLKYYDFECICAAHSILSKDPPPNISIERLAHKVGINRTKLQCGFKLVYGTNINDFQIEKRMEKAKLLLITTDKAIKNIAPLSGYKNSSSFVAVFRRTTGLTPLQYRKRNAV